VLIVNVLLIVPAATVTVAGTDASVLSDAIATTVPPAGADPESTTVPTDVFEPTTLLGATETDDNLGESTTQMPTTLD
jgi:hypothetical protein